MKFIPYHRIIDPNENSFDLLSVNELDKEKNSNLFLRKKKLIFYLKKTNQYHLKKKKTSLIIFGAHPDFLQVIVII